EAIKAIVANAIGQQQVAIVKHAHKAGRVAARRYIGPLDPLRADDAKCRACQDGAAMPVEAAQNLAARPAHRLWVYVAQVLDCRDVADLRGVEGLRHRSTPCFGGNGPFPSATLGCGQPGLAPEPTQVSYR